MDELVPQGESRVLEFKKSTAVLASAFETLCGFLNGGGGKVLIGVTDDGKIIGQQVSDSTLREISETIKKIEPPPAIEIDRVVLLAGKEVILLTATPLFPLIALREALVNAFCHRL